MRKITTHNGCECIVQRTMQMGGSREYFYSKFKRSRVKTIANTNAIIIYIYIYNIIIIHYNISAPTHVCLGLAVWWRRYCSAYQMIYNLCTAATDCCSIRASSNHEPL